MLLCWLKSELLFQYDCDIDWLGVTFKFQTPAGKQVETRIWTSYWRVMPCRGATCEFHFLWACADDADECRCLAPLDVVDASGNGWKAILVGSWPSMPQGILQPSCHPHPMQSTIRTVSKKTTVSKTSKFSTNRRIGAFTLHHDANPNRKQDQPHPGHGRYFQRPNRGPLSRLCFICGSGSTVIAFLSKNFGRKTRQPENKMNSGIFGVPSLGTEAASALRNNLVLQCAALFVRQNRALEKCREWAWHQTFCGPPITKAYLNWLQFEATCPFIKLEKMKVRKKRAPRQHVDKNGFQIQIPRFRMFLHRNRIVQVSQDAEVKIHTTIQTPQGLKFKFPPREHAIFSLILLYMLPGGRRWYLCILDHDSMYTVYI